MIKNDLIWLSCGISTLVTIGLVIICFKPEAPIIKPSYILHFQPVCKESDPNDIIVAQAELCRHGIDVEIDGKCGKKTALGICELLVRIEDGYEVHSIYERSHNVEEKNH